MMLSWNPIISTLSMIRKGGEMEELGEDFYEGYFEAIIEVVRAMNEEAYVKCDDLFKRLIRQAIIDIQREAKHNM